MKVRNALAWAIGVTATVALLFGIYAWTVFRLGVHLPFSRSIPFPAYEWLLDVERALSVVPLAIVAVTLGAGMRTIRRRQVSIVVPSWTSLLVVVFVLAVMADIATLLWQEYLLEVPSGPEDAHGAMREHDMVQYASAVAHLVIQWCFLMWIAAAIVRTRRGGPIHATEP